MPKIDEIIENRPKYPKIVEFIEKNHDFLDQKSVFFFRFLEKKIVIFDQKIRKNRQKYQKKIENFDAKFRLKNTDFRSPIVCQKWSSFFELLSTDFVKHRNRS